MDLKTGPMLMEIFLCSNDEESSTHKLIKNDDGNNGRRSERISDDA